MTQWKKALLGGAGSVFEKEKDKGDEELKRQQKEDCLYKQIGHMQVQVDILKEVHRKCGVPVQEDELDRLG